MKVQVLDNLRARGHALFQAVDRRLRGAPGVLARAFDCFGRARAAESAASLAYYGLFALFPFLLVLIFIGTLFLGSKRAETELIATVTQMLPGSQLVIQQNLADVMERRGPLTLVGVIGLVWSASGFFAALTRNLRRAWPDFAVRNMIEQRLTGIGAVLLLGLLLILWSAANVVLNSVPQLLNNVPGADTFWHFFVRILPVFLVFPMLVGLYHWTAPPGHSWRAVLIGAAVAAGVLQTLTIGFGWYLGSGLVHFDVVYGSLGGLIALLLFVYLMSTVILFGAYLAAVIQERAKVASPLGPASPPGPLS